jgi:hypothetical protein
MTSSVGGAAAYFHVQGPPPPPHTAPVFPSAAGGGWGTPDRALVCAKCLLHTPSFTHHAATRARRSREARPPSRRWCSEARDGSAVGLKWAGGGPCVSDPGGGWGGKRVLTGGGVKRASGNGHVRGWTGGRRRGSSRRHCLAARLGLNGLGPERDDGAAAIEMRKGGGVETMRHAGCIVARPCRDLNGGFGERRLCTFHLEVAVARPGLATRLPVLSPPVPHAR